MDGSDIYEETVEVATDGENESIEDENHHLKEEHLAESDEADIGDEVVIGQEEEVMEQSLDEILITKPDEVIVNESPRGTQFVKKQVTTGVLSKNQSNQIYKRINPVVQRVAVVPKSTNSVISKSTVVLKSPTSITSIPNSANKPQTIKIISSSGQKVISVPKLSNFKITTVNPGQIVTSTAQQQPLIIDQNRLSLKRKTDGSPLIVNLDNLKRVKTIQPTTPNAKPISSTPLSNTKFIRVLKTNNTQTDICGDILDQYQQIIEEDQEKIAILEDQLRKLKYSPEMFENDDKRTEYFTGLDSFITMITLFNTCENELPLSSSLTKFEIFILTLLKLRHRLPLQFLSYQFGVTLKAANFYFNECLSVLHKSLRELFTEPVEMD